MQCSYSETTPSKFAQAKTSTLAAVDLSKKGSVDQPISNLIELVNNLDDYFTTSSCSGRTIIVANSLAHGSRKKGCKWLYVTHGDSVFTDVIECLREEPLPESATLKFEPFIMHVQCLSLESARQLLQIAVSCGYRNSGISLGKSGKIILAVRSTAGLEVPLVVDSRLLVSEQYIERLVGMANEKMSSNLMQISKFQGKLDEFAKEQR
ncbi:TYW3 [Bugula neritina]|uniref:tRNA wybutosine-synthesizing protein 3 homolog n=1 Tax=Bugula neritina TaxID=10212 RepID=A0A7J7KTM4_BUGNE|nr:TYW3 [Bugula neritina]